MLTELDVGNDLTADVSIEAADELLAPHGEVGPECGDAQMDIERLVEDVGVQRVLTDGGTGHLGPCLDEPLLQEWHFQPLLPQVAQYQVLDFFYVSTKQYCIYLLFDFRKLRLLFVDREFKEFREFRTIPNSLISSHIVGFGVDRHTS